MVKNIANYKLCQVMKKKKSEKETTKKNGAMLECWLPFVGTKQRVKCSSLSGWSAPSAIGLAGLGGGFEVGMEVINDIVRGSFLLLSAHPPLSVSIPFSTPSLCLYL